MAGKKSEDDALVLRAVKMATQARLAERFVELMSAGVLQMDHMVLLHYFDAKRMTPRLWKQVHQVFDEVMDRHGEYGYALFVAEGYTTYSFLAWDRVDGGLGSERNSWWNPIEFYEDPTPRRDRPRRNATKAAHTSQIEEKESEDTED